MMNDDVKDMILQSLARIEGKLDSHGIEISAISQRLAVLEAKCAAQEKVNEQVDELAQKVDKGMGAKSVIAWLIATAIGIASWFK